MGIEDTLARIEEKLDRLLGEDKGGYLIILGDIPEWAESIAMDKDGTWNYYECEINNLEVDSIEWLCEGGYDFEYASPQPQPFLGNWRDSARNLK